MTANLNNYDEPKFPMSSSRNWDDAGWEKCVVGGSGCIASTTFYVYLKMLDHRTVALKFPKITWTSTATLGLTTIYALPSKYRPAVDRLISGFYVACDGSGLLGQLLIETTGIMIIAPPAVNGTYGMVSGLFTDTKPAIIYSTILTYDLELDI